MGNSKSRIFVTLFNLGKKYNRSIKYVGYYPFKILYYFYSQYILGCDIRLTTQIGKGFEIFHGARGSVISPTTIIGDNVSLRQNTTIGAKGFQGAEKSPIIGNNVTIGPNVCIIGDIHIGDNSTIGAGAVVVKNVRSGTVVVGNPAREVQPKSSDNN